MKKLFYSLILLVLIQHTKAQSLNKNGLLLEEETYQQLPAAEYFSPQRGDDLPRRVSLKDHCPIPQDQGIIASCVAHALAHAFTIQNAKNVTYSASFIFNHIKEGNDCFKGAFLSKGLEFLLNVGDCTIEDFQNGQYECSKQADDGLRKKAAAFKIEGYEKLFESDDSVNQKINQIRVQLARGKPIIIGMNVPAGFRLKAPGQLNWRDAKNGHALVVIGYDHNQDTFELINSYGPNWRDGGFFSLSYHALGSNLLYGYILK